MPDTTGMAAERRRIRLEGIVQGVGFRPFTLRIARESGLAGFVRNESGGVVIEAEGPAAVLDRFLARLLSEHPPHARVVRHRVEPLSPCGGNDFTIQFSAPGSAAATFIAPDLAVCSECLAEMNDPAGRRHHYPFLNCTRCGPRFSIVRSLPYDRSRTSMAAFAMCPECRAEYEDPGDRRFHAQPTACPACGPRLWLTDASGTELPAEDPVAAVWKMLQQGRIVAVRGLGGFHLCVDAQNEAAITTLRQRKGRSRKPFALMARDLETIRRWCDIGAAEKGVLESPARPIVLLRAKSAAEHQAQDPAAAPGLLPWVIAPGQRYQGFMLPYTPLHYQLLAGPLPVLVMTSGNLAEEPIAIGTAEALSRLGGIADAFLLHDREILQRCDDSILRCEEGHPMLIRRSRGYVPDPILLEQPLPEPLLAVGGELKNTIALGRGREVFLSQHIGDLDNPAALSFFDQAAGHLQSLLRIEPHLIVHDLHPDYLSTQWALAQPQARRIAVQHHHAHFAAVLAEHRVEGPCIGILLDGTGYGSDGTIWGGEVLLGNAASVTREAWLQPVPMPGGTAAVREPWRMALSHLHAALGRDCLDLDLEVMHYRPRAEMELLLDAMEKGINAPLTSSCGRFFDAVAAIMGLCFENTFEAEAAMTLEMTAAPSDSPRPPLEEIIGRDFEPSGPIRLSHFVQRITRKTLEGCAASVVAWRFHLTLADIFLLAVQEVRRRSGVDRVVLSGGVFQNALLHARLRQILSDAGFQVFSPRLVPANDGGLALGQIAVAAARLQRG
ncbi:MAG TPA: carbamoyltransferase HypF [bacterium]|nr:carbamoyltransferase HypF [bacterium]HPR88088.1 carbamoyltransferase HypF [bacterium]